MLRILKSADYKTTEWAGGKTTEILIWPVDGDYGKREFDWRLSSATVDLPESDFTDLTGFDRFITVLDGELVLEHGDGIRHEVKGQKVYAFSGGIKTHSTGTGRDFNLIYKNSLPCEMGRKEVAEGQSISLELPSCGFLGVFIISGTVDISCGDSEYFGVGENQFLLADSLDDEKEMNIYAKNAVDLIICTLG